MTSVSLPSILSSPKDSIAVPYPHSLPLSSKKFDTNPSKCYHKSSSAVRSLFLPKCLESASISGKEFTGKFPGCLILQRTRIRTNAIDDDTLGSGNTEDGTQVTVEQGKRILALQKDLLEQIAERKKLVTNLKKNLGQASEQVKDYDNSDTKLEESSSLKEDLPKMSPMTTDVKLTEKQAVAGSQFDASRKARPVIDSETSPSPSTKSSEKQLGSSLVGASTQKSKSASYLVQSPPMLRKEKAIPSTKEDEKEIINEEKSDGPVSAGSASSKDESAPPLAGLNVMNVILIAAECAPWVKTGGLGDVAGALPKALARRGHRVMVVVPRYSSYAEAREIGVRKRYNVAGQDMEVSYFHGYIDGVDHVFIDHPIFYGFANNIYGGNREKSDIHAILFAVYKQSICGLTLLHPSCIQAVCLFCNLMSCS
ncbi:hypothetical protein KP509_14G059800 [Ceratopteris richardii]|uniref:Starch synthase catalytic domain-containing protein n=1 Tax=Ceratopteris richardii TaxID=49495 RepID=A0A8T2TDH5_CERRI|nr:hypothetical protein KP509_14G059800 [Ceratopteris richardii]